MARTTSGKIDLKTVIISALIGAVIAGGAVYAWQQQELKAALKPYQKSDEEQIREVATADCEAEVGFIASKPDIKIKGDTAFASLGCYKGSPDASGYGIVLKRVNTSWIAIYKNQQAPGKNVCQKFGLNKDWCQDYDSVGY